MNPYAEAPASAGCGAAFRTTYSYCRHLPILSTCAECSCWDSPLSPASQHLLVGRASRPTAPARPLRPVPTLDREHWYREHWYREHWYRDDHHRIDPDDHNQHRI